MCQCDSIATFAVSIITAIVAIVAVFQTKAQIKQSNKQQLFDRRLSNYVLINKVLSTYKENRNLVVDSPHLIFLLKNPSIFM